MKTIDLSALTDDELTAALQAASDEHDNNLGEWILPFTEEAFRRFGYKGKVRVNIDARTWYGSSGQ